MSEWPGVTPDYIVSNWTEELLDLMLQKLIGRKEREAEALRGKGTSGLNGASGSKQVVSDEVLFARLGHKIKRVKSS